MPKDVTPEERIAKCFETAVNYIAVSPRSEKEVVEKLYSKGYHRNEVEEAISKCKGYHYIDDEAYARSFIDYYGGKLGRRLLAYKMTSVKGVNATIAANAIDDFVTDEVEKEKCLRLARKYASAKHITERQDFQKIGRYLSSKGFDWDIINFALEALKDEDND